MKLREYLFQHNIMQKDFADMIGYSRVFVGYIVNEMTRPCSKRAKKAIVEATKGQVTEDDLTYEPRG